jgi:hypothetical protein
MPNYLKTTSISGRDTDRDSPERAPTLERLEWFENHHVLLHRLGHRSPETALRAARHAGAIGSVEVTHKTLDLNGRGYGGIDRRFSVSESGVTEIHVSFEEDADEAEMQTDDYWEVT